MRFLSEKAPFTQRGANEQPYDIEDGVIVDRVEHGPKPYTREFNAAQRPGPTETERILEEMEWEARSGPVTIRHKEES